MECKEIIDDVASNKITIDELQTYFDCFLSLQHFLRFNTAIKLNKKIAKVGSYVYFDLGYERPASYVAGIDDTTQKIFCMPVRTCYLYYDSEIEIRKCMGFNYHYYEKFNYGDGITIRLQGDLTMEIVRAYDKVEDLLNFIDQRREEFRELWENFIRSKLAKDPEIQKAEVLIGSYQELRDFALNTRIYREEDKNDVISVVKLARKLEPEIKALAKKYDIHLLNVFEKPRATDERRYKCIRFIDIEDFGRKLRQKKISQMGNFKDYILENEKKITLRIGHYTTAHEIKLTGVMMNAIEGRRIEIAILRPQTIEINHPEHGKTSFNIPKPTYAVFRLMGL
ncbi:hypothetical protein DFR86_10365 [Acidianus sulfidivorans JP7]|uniref:hypothetical protein n=1 Tax=Acidianus sulfidivorans TaxID=312539 RepID=UPI001442FCFE|nr:hypothetical protein [Acidianus sulfidivorans]AWR97900.2 hypothetical protein DFR86_10365 [Acidianus sulfidivorans JP7]